MKRVYLVLLFLAFWVDASQASWGLFAGRYRMDILQSHHRSYLGCDAYLPGNWGDSWFCDEEGAQWGLMGSCMECNGPWSFFDTGPRPGQPGDMRGYWNIGSKDDFITLLDNGRQEFSNCGARPYAIGAPGNPYEIFCGAYIHLGGASLTVPDIEGLIGYWFDSSGEGFSGSWAQAQVVFYDIYDDPVIANATPWERRFKLFSYLWEIYDVPVVPDAGDRDVAEDWAAAMLFTMGGWFSWEIPNDGGEEFLDLLGIEPFCFTLNCAPAFMLYLEEQTSWIGDDPYTKADAMSFSAVKALY